MATPRKSFKYFLQVPVGLPGEALVHGVGHREPMSNSNVLRPVGTGDWLIMYFYEPGFAGNEIDESAHRGQHLIFWPPGMIQHYGSPRSRWHHTWIHGDGSVFEMLESLGLPPGRAMRMRDPSRFEFSLLLIDRELEAPAGPDPIVLRILLEIMIRQLASACGAATREQIPLRFRRIQRFLDENTHRPHALSDLSRSFHISIPHLSAEFHRHFGVAPIAYSVQARLKRAAYLLHDHNRSVAEVGHDIGFEDPAHFSRSFRKQFARSPRAYRDAQTKRRNRP